tara:strand:- start:485 stop:655 length:171 start_codon:yes stop_codon:yes gene_type:complete
MRVVIKYQDQFHRWLRYGEVHNVLSAYTTAKSRAKATGKRFKLVDKDDKLIDLIEP